MSGVSPDKDGGAELSIIKGIILQGPPNISVNAGYGVLKNITDEDITLIRLTSPVFDGVLEISANVIERNASLPQLRSHRRHQGCDLIKSRD